MPTVTVPRTDLSTEEMVTVLRDGLGADYNVLPGMTMASCPSEARAKAGRTSSWSAPATTGESRRR